MTINLTPPKPPFVPAGISNPRQERVIVTPIPAPEGVVDLRFSTSGGKYLGEIRMFAIDDQATAIMLTTVLNKFNEAVQKQEATGKGLWLPPGVKS